jgi:hypothetical protein
MRPSSCYACGPCRLCPSHGNIQRPKLSKPRPKIRVNLAVLRFSIPALSEHGCRLTTVSYGFCLRTWIGTKGTPFLMEASDILSPSRPSHPLRRAWTLRSSPLDGWITKSRTQLGCTRVQQLILFDQRRLLIQRASFSILYVGM